MEARGWAVPVIASPAGCLHLPVTERLLDAGRGAGAGAGAPAPAWVELLADLDACCRAARERPREGAFEGKGEAGIYGAAVLLPQGKVAGVLHRYLDVLSKV